MSTDLNHGADPSGSKYMLENFTTSKAMSLLAKSIKCSISTTS